MPAKGEKAATDKRYRLEANGRLHCKYCGQSFGVKSNQALRPIARYYLSLSLPFADCPNEDCDHHGLNVFEHYDPRHRPYYRAGSDYRAGCKACRRQVHTDSKDGIARSFRWTLGEAQHKGDMDLWLKRRLKTIIKGVLSGSSVTNTLEALGELALKKRNCQLKRRDIKWQAKIKVNPESYYNQLIAISRCLRDYHAWRNVRLLNPGLNTIDRKTPARVYTDVMQVSLKKYGRGARHEHLNVIISVLAQRQTYFILAVHPFFLPEAYAMDTRQWFRRRQSGQPSYTDDWDCLWRPGQADTPDIKTAMVKGELSGTGKNGLFIRSPYAEAAHFLTVQKMLNRHDKVYYYMDAARDLYSAALCALANEVRTGQVEIALFQHDKQRETAPTNKADKDPRNVLDEANQAMEARFEEAMQPKGQLPLRPAGERKLRAGVFKSAFEGGYSKKGGWAWLAYPPDSVQYGDCRSLWLTRMPDKTFDEDGAELMLHATLQPVDSFINAMRQRIRAMQRPTLRAKAGRSFMRNYSRIDAVLGELWIYMLYRNYRLRLKTEQAHIPAHLLGLMTDKQAGRAINTLSEEDFLEKFLGFRLSLKHARIISQWQQRP